MMRAAALGALAALTILAAAQPGFTQPSEELKNLRKEVDTLKEGQKGIQSDLQEIKQLLRARPAGAAPAADQPFVMSIEGVPFKGNKTAKVMVVEITDYQ